MVKYCPNCGSKLVDSAKFCKDCGVSIQGNENIPNTNNADYTYQNDHTLVMVLGFICAFLIPILGVIFGIYMYTRKDNDNAKTYGIIMIILSVIVWFISALLIR